MTPVFFSYVDGFRVGAFCTLIAIIYYMSVRWLLDRFLKRQPRNAVERLYQKAGPVFLVLSVAGLVCMGYGFLIEPNRLTVTNYTIESDKLPDGECIRIVHLADLHIREKGTRETKLPELVQSLEPDLILHTGDFFGRSDNMEPVVVELLKSWDVPQFACRGNLDRLGDFDGVLESASVNAPEGETETIEVRGVPVTISGFPSGAESAMKRVLEPLPKEPFNIVLYHHPSGFTETWRTPTDLMLAGHTHGGQVRMPFYGALVTMDRYGKRYEYGCYDEKQATLIVSRGIGCEPATPEVRFLCPPEVVVIEIVGTGQSPKL